MRRFCKIFPGICLIVTALLFAGCGLSTKDIKTTTLQVDSDGHMKEVMVDSSKGATFTEDDIKAFMKDDLAQFTAKGGSTDVTLDEVKITENLVRMDMSYGSYLDYANYHNTEIFYGTFADAQQIGYKFDCPLADNSGEVAALATIEANDDGWHVLILQEPMDVVTPGNILYASTNVKITGKKTATIQPEEDNSEAITLASMAYIIFK
ncbi:MAG: hypothetical protein PHG16_06595 [Lachnospiraceae bacterium]|nr:hypothetical protein [Lachnospiraceae bacterium]